MNTSKLTALIASFVCALSLTACTINTGGADENTSNTTDSTEESSDDVLYAGLEQVWSDPSIDQEDLCAFFNTAPDMAYGSFNEGWESDMNSDFPRDVFDNFFSEHC